MDVLRLAGVPGVGKSTVAWAVARGLAADGERVGYVDIDQLGMCYPAPPDDPDRWDLKEAALQRVAARFAEARVERLVVSGVADPADPPRANGHPTVSLWLDAEEVTRRERLAPRGWPQGQVDEVVAIGTAESATAHPSWAKVDTDGRVVEDTVRTVLARWRTDAATAATTVPPVPAPASTEDDRTGRVIWITGPRCSGASSVAWEIASARWAEGLRTGFVDVAQLGFAWNAHRAVGTRNTAEMQGLFAGVGAQTLVVTAPFEIDPAEVGQAFPHADLRFFRLDADPETLRARAVRRTTGEGPRIIGDDLLDGAPEAVDLAVAQGVRQRQTPVRAGEQMIDATTSSASEIAEAVRAHLPD